MNTWNTISKYVMVTYFASTKKVNYTMISEICISLSLIPRNLIEHLTFMVPCIMIKFRKMTNKMQLCRIIYCSLTALHVSSDIFAHYQEHLNCIYSFWCYSLKSLPAGVMGELELSSNSPMTPAGNDLSE